MSGIVRSKHWFFIIRSENSDSPPISLELVSYMIVSDNFEDEDCIPYRAGYVYMNIRRRERGMRRLLSQSGLVELGCDFGGFDASTPSECADCCRNGNYFEYGSCPLSFGIRNGGLCSGLARSRLSKKRKRSEEEILASRKREEWVEKDNENKRMRRLDNLPSDYDYSGEFFDMGKNNTGNGKNIPVTMDDIVEWDFNEHEFRLAFEKYLLDNPDFDPTK